MRDARGEGRHRLGEVEGARGGVDEGDAEGEKAGGDGAEDQVLESRLGSFGLLSSKAMRM